MTRRRSNANFLWKIVAAIVCSSACDLGAAETFTITLGPKSAYSTGCFPPCLCPISFTEGVSGTLEFTFTERNPLFEQYLVAADLTVPGNPAKHLTGKGTYKVGGEVLLAQEMTLQLTTEGGPTEDFHSGTVPEQSGFPAAIDIQLSIKDLQCVDTLIHLVSEPLPSPGAAFVRGDCNADGPTDISDAVSGLLYLFGGGQKPSCEDACDANDDGQLDISDAVTTLGFLFLGGGALPAPGPSCGADPTEDLLSCEAYAPCAAAACKEIAADITRETSIVGSCSAVVRLDATTRRIVGWQIICGKYARPTEETARATAEADTGYGGGHMLSREPVEDEFVFYEPPGDFGGTGVVSARNGLSVFGGSIVWDGRGDVTYPAEWRTPESLGGECAPFAGAISARGYDLVMGEAGLPEDEISATLDVVRRTPIFDGMAAAGSLFDAVVILYPRSVGVFDPSSAEWIVIVNAGWLE